MASSSHSTLCQRHLDGANSINMLAVQLLRIKIDEVRSMVQLLGIKADKQQNLKRDWSILYLNIG